MFQHETCAMQLSHVTSNTEARPSRTISSPMLHTPLHISLCREIFSMLVDKQFKSIIREPVNFSLGSIVEAERDVDVDAEVVTDSEVTTEMELVVVGAEDEEDDFHRASRAALATAFRFLFVLDFSEGLRWLGAMFNSLQLACVFWHFVVYIWRLIVQKPHPHYESH